VSYNCWTITGEESSVNEDGVAALHHAEMAGELTALQSAVSSAVELVLVRSPNETFWVEVTDEQVAKF
jgi:hypothetical protein